jgi:hypothetical protein
MRYFIYIVLVIDCCAWETGGNSSDLDSISLRGMGNPIALKLLNEAAILGESK